MRVTADGSTVGTAADAFWVGALWAGMFWDFADWAGAL
jgi:hypothetical protein